MLKCKYDMLYYYSEPFFMREIDSTETTRFGEMAPFDQQSWMIKFAANFYTFNQKYFYPKDLNNLYTIFTDSYFWQCPTVMLDLLKIRKKQRLKELKDIEGESK